MRVARSYNFALQSSVEKDAKNEEGNKKRKREKKEKKKKQKKKTTTCSGSLTGLTHVYRKPGGLEPCANRRHMRLHWSFWAVVRVTASQQNAQMLHTAGKWSQSEGELWLILPLPRKPKACMHQMCVRGMLLIGLAWRCQK